MCENRFALPTLATASMSKADQAELLVNQATSAIVCSYLEHMNVMRQTGSTSGENWFTPDELVTLIDKIQGALRS